MIFSVNNATELLSAMKSASGGDTIFLESGTYAGVVLNGFNFSGGRVTITSAQSEKAVFSDLKLYNSSGINFDSVEFSASGIDTLPFRITAVRDVDFVRTDWHGPSGQYGFPSALMLVRESANVRVTDSEFHNAAAGIGQLNMSNMTISGNKFHDIRVDGINGGGSSNLTIANNYFTDFRPQLGDHGDAIQIWTTNTTKPATNISIVGNVITRGDGGRIQGIFVADSSTGYTSAGNLNFEDVTVKDNSVIGMGYNSLFLYGVRGANVANNQILGFADEPARIRMQHVSGTVVDNLARQYVWGIGTGDIATRNNLNSDTIYDGGSAALAALVSSNTISAAIAAFLGVSTNGSQPLASPSTPTSPSDTLVGTAANDVFTVTSTTTRIVEALNGGKDKVVASASHTLDANVEDLDLTAAGLTGTGNALDNVLRAHWSGSTLHGLDGADRLFGNSGADRLYGGNGDDYIAAGAGNDMLDGGAGVDTLLGGDGDDNLFGGDGSDTLWGDNGNDALDGGSGDDRLQGLAGNDRLIGGLGNDLLEGGVGDDRLLGGDGADRLFGGVGNDTLDGGTGRDVLYGGAGNDVMTGGDQADLFTFTRDDRGGYDRILDFDRTEGDRIDLRGLAGTGFDKAMYIGMSAFSGMAGQVRSQSTDPGTLIQVDLNGDRVADLHVLLVGVPSLDFYDLVM